MPSGFHRRLHRLSSITARKPDPRAAPGPVQTACTTIIAGWRVGGTNPEAVPVHQVLITVENPEVDQATRRAPDTPTGL